MLIIAILFFLGIWLFLYADRMEHESTVWIIESEISRLSDLEARYHKLQNSVWVKLGRCLGFCE